MMREWCIIGEDGKRWQYATNDCDRYGWHSDGRAGEVEHERLSHILDQLDQRGIPFVIATGNGYSRMAHVLGDLKDRVTLVLANGARILEKGKLIRECSWPEELVQEVLQYLEGREEELHLVVSSLSGGYARKEQSFLF